MCRPTYCYQLLMRLQRRSCSSELDRPNFYYQESLEICYINENPTINHTIHRDFRKDVQVVLSSRCRPGMSRERVARGIRGGITFRVAASTLLHQASPSSRPCGSSGDSIRNVEGASGQGNPRRLHFPRRSLDPPAPGVAEHPPLWIQRRFQPLLPSGSSPCGSTSPDPPVPAGEASRPPPSCRARARARRPRKRNSKSGCA